MKTIEDVAARSTDEKIFTVLDVSQAFYQVKLSDRELEMCSSGWCPSVRYACSCCRGCSLGW